MKRFFSAAAALLIFVLFFQLNHIGLMSFSNPHGATLSCSEAKQTRSPEKCICCLIEQADKSSQVNVAPFISLVRSGFSPNTDVTYPTAATPRPNFSQTPFKTNRWLSTVVQRK